MGLTLAQLEPGMLIKTPDIFKALGWDPVSIFAGGDPVYPAFYTAHGETLTRQMWLAGPGGKPAPMQEEFEPVEDKKIYEVQKTQASKGFGLMGYNYYSGCDPEFFVVDGKGELFPATKFLRSKKASPHVFYDGLQAEIAPNGDSCLERLSNNIVALLTHTLSAAKQHDKLARITLQNSFKLTGDQLKNLSEEALRFRCSSSLNIYNDGGELPNAREYPWRFAGGHIHIGCGKRTPGTIKQMVRALDGILGVAGVSLARNWDNPERRRMYGRAGEFRLPAHGLEYRVLSNYWLSSPLIYHLTFEIARYAYRIGEAGLFDVLYEGTEKEIRDCINYHNVELACDLIKRNLPLYTRIFKQIWGGYSSNASRRALDTLQNGLEVAVTRPSEVTENWNQFSGSYPMTWARMFG